MAFVPFIFPFCLRGCYLFRQPEYLYTDVYSSSSTTALGDGGAARSTVFTNEVAFEVAAGPLNIKETFGHEAVLLDHSGHPVLTDEWGVTIHPLQHGACYYLVSFHFPSLQFNTLSRKCREMLIFGHLAGLEELGLPREIESPRVLAPSY
ncbi:hypothetical protein C4D60_Mb09t05930 [Musa balbisiana]|uniref:Uncharacterized protein n=1 Tax=Musa balbisiana TaxID=52838 RepID=A0A4S8IGR2_MUSBA|nr:hypothetical protein C4D60_Mb09t05930 [Musa balbisiana]